MWSESVCVCAWVWCVEVEVEVWGGVVCWVLMRQYFDVEGANKGFTLLCSSTSSMSLPSPMDECTFSAKVLVCYVRWSEVRWIEVR